MSRNFEVLQRIEREAAASIEPAATRLGVRVDKHFTANYAGNGNSSHLSQIDQSAREELTKLIQQLFVFPVASKRVVVFSAAEPNNGCSWVTAHAAEALASRVSAEVCVVDANFHRPALHDYFAVHNDCGFHEALLQPATIKTLLRRLPIGNLSIMTSGSLSDADPGLFMSARFDAMIDELRSEFDYVLIDAPPLSLYNDALVLGRAADGIALVVEAHSTRRQAAENAVKHILNARVHLLGAVLNKRTFPIPAALYSKLPYQRATG